MDLNSLPIVGQPFAILRGYTTAIIQCQCERKGLVVLIGLNNAAACPDCGNVYAIASTGTMTIGHLQRGDTLSS